MSRVNLTLNARQRKGNSRSLVGQKSASLGMSSKKREARADSSLRSLRRPQGKQNDRVVASTALRDTANQEIGVPRGVQRKAKLNLIVATR